MDLLKELLLEATPGMDSIKMPKKLAVKMFKEFDISHDEKPEEVIGTPTKAKAEGRMLIRINNDGSAHAMVKRWGGWSVWTYDPSTKKVTHKSEPNYSDAKKLLRIRKNNGKTFITMNVHSRREKPESDIESVRDREDVGIPGDDIYSYMSKTFLPKIRLKLDRMADGIYAGLRAIPRNYDQYGRKSKNRGYGDKSAREVAMRAAEAIEDIAERGFTRDTMEQFLQFYGEYHTGFASVPANEREFERLMKEEPAARAKFANVIVKIAKKHFDRIQELKRDIAEEEKE